MNDEQYSLSLDDYQEQIYLRSITARDKLSDKKTAIESLRKEIETKQILLADLENELRQMELDFDREYGS